MMLATIAEMLILFVLGVVYVFAVYAKCFKRPNSLPMSSGAISFFNFLFGGLIFGCLWNRCLTRGSIGISHIVFVVFQAVAVFLVFITIPYMSYY